MYRLKCFGRKSRETVKLTEHTEVVWGGSLPGEVGRVPLPGSVRTKGGGRRCHLMTMILIKLLITVLNALSLLFEQFDKTWL